MRGLSRSAPGYRRHRASGQAVVTLSGKDFYLGPWKSKTSIDEYDRLIREWLERGRSLKPLESAPQGRQSKAVVEIIAAYLRYADEYYRKNGEPTREIGCIREAAKVLKRLYGRTDADQFGPVALQAVRSEMISLGWGRIYINKQIGRIVRMFRWCTSQELVRPGVVQGLETVQGLRKGRTQAPDHAPVLPVDDAIVERTLEKLPQVVADMVRIQRFTGARPMEVCLLRPCDIDRSSDVWVYTPAEHKTEHHGRSRTVCIGPRAQNILMPYLLRAAEAYCFSPADSEKKRRALQHANRKTRLSCGNRPGTNRKASRTRPPRDRYDVDSYRRAIHRACKAAGVEKWAPNRLRHTAATEVRKRFGLEAAQVTLGHSQASVTQVYAERDLALAAKVAKTVG